MKNQELVIIIRRSSEFLSIKDSLKLLCLNQYFSVHFPNLEYYRNLSTQMMSEISDLDAYDSSFLDLCSLILSFRSKTDFYRTLKNLFNLIKNPFGSLGFECYKIRS